MSHNKKQSHKTQTKTDSAAQPGLINVLLVKTQAFLENLTRARAHTTCLYVNKLQLLWIITVDKSYTISAIHKPLSITTQTIKNSASQELGQQACCGLNFIFYIIVIYVFFSSLYISRPFLDSSFVHPIEVVSPSLFVFFRSVSSFTQTFALYSSLIRYFRILFLKLLTDRTNVIITTWLRTLFF